MGKLIIEVCHRDLDDQALCNKIMGEGLEGISIFYAALGEGYWSVIVRDGETPVCGEERPGG